MLKKKPDLSIEEVSEIIKDKYEFSAICKELDGERDQNFLVQGDDDSWYVLKIINPDEDNIFIEAQADVLNYLAKKIKLCPVIVKTKTGSDISEIIAKSGNKYSIRMVSYLNGKTMGLLKQHSPDLLHRLGNKLGIIDDALAGYENVAFRRKFNWDLNNFEEIVYDYRDLVSEVHIKTFIDNTLSEFHDIVKPIWGKLRKSVIHNDANDYNIIVNCEGLEECDMAGLIDFGDMVYSYTVADPAVAMAYIITGNDEPLRAAAIFLRGYNKSFELEEDEIKVLFTMAKMRLVLSLCIAAYQQRERPDDKYLTISQEPISKIIPVIENIHPLYAETVFRIECDKPPIQRLISLHEEIKEYGKNAFPVMGEVFTKENTMALDLGLESKLIEGDTELNSASRLGERIENVLKENNSNYGIGRFAEPRLLYSSSVFQGERFTNSEDRTIHLGMDIFAPEGSPVYAPLDGYIHLFAYNPGKLDYGHILIIKHKTHTGIEFYTLYGHLARMTFNNMETGKKVSRGEVIAWLGNTAENGGWSSHLHFQIITDLLYFGTGYPGVCKPWDSNAWQLLSPDPDLILNIPEGSLGVKGTGFKETHRKRKQYFSDSLSLSYKKPLKIVRGWKQYLYDENGQQYIDAYNNVPHIGHCHPEVIEAAYEQMRLLNTNTRYLNDHLNEFAEILLGTFQKPLEVCFFLNSASEANELALRLAFTYTRRRDVIVLEGAYHGNTNTLIDISPYKHGGPGGRGAPPWVHTAPVPDLYRGEFRYGDDKAGIKYAHYIEHLIEDMKKKDRYPAAFIAETCPSVGGQIIFPGGYLSEVYRIMRNCGALCIADEVQTAYGRMGSSFYAYEDQGVVPDIVVLGKPIGNGHPLAAVVTTREIAAAFNTGMEFFSTFGGNTVSAIVGKKVLEIVLRDGYMKHAHETGTYLLKMLKPLSEIHPLIGDIRGSGLFLGMELVRNHETLEPAGREASYIKERLRDMKILIGTDGPYDNVLKIRPPMPFNEENAEILADRLSKVFEMTL